MTNIEPLLDSWKKDTLTHEERLRLLHLLENEEGQFHSIWLDKWAEQQIPVSSPAGLEGKLAAIHASLKQQIQLDREAKRAQRIRMIVSIAVGMVILLFGSWFTFQVLNPSSIQQESALASTLMKKQVEPGEK
ncbi:MAG: hypothetical protein AAF399_15965, partial [Bacteroidota bacterium]